MSTPLPGRWLMSADENGDPIATSLEISVEFKRRHNNVLQSIDSLIGDGTIVDSDFKLSHYLDSRNKRQRMIQLTERGYLIAMPFIGGMKSRAGQRELVMALMYRRSAIAKKAAL